VKVSGHCISNVEVLEENYIRFAEEEKNLNEKLTKELNIYWDKKDIPSAVLYLIKELQFL